MRRIFFCTTCVCALMGAAAQAHPGDAILTTGSGERTVTTEGVSIEEISGVHLFRGTPAPLENALMGGEASTENVAEECADIIVKVLPFRSIRRLRTQGFYSGDYPSRRYTQGFYSGY